MLSKAKPARAISSITSSKSDHTKLGRVATTHVVPLTAIDTVVTDTGAPTQAIADLQAAGTNVIVAELTP